MPDDHALDKPEKIAIRVGRYLHATLLVTLGLVLIVSRLVIALVARLLVFIEESVLVVFVLAMAFVPMIDILGDKLFDKRIPGATEYLKHTTIWLAFIGAMAANRYNKHIKIGNLSELLPPRWKTATTLFASFMAVAVCASMVWASLLLIASEAPALPERFREFIPASMHSFCENVLLFDGASGAKVGNKIPFWIALCILPVGFAVMTLRFIWSSSRLWWGKVIAASSIFVMAYLAIHAYGGVVDLVWPFILLLIVAGIFGAPIFTILGGVALLLYWKGIEFYPDTGPLPTSSFSLMAMHGEFLRTPIYAIIPIFTLIGFCLSESKASERLGVVFRSWLGWAPGGTAVAATLLCAFFTTFTGASGVTILALGGLFLPILIKSKFPEPFSIGLLTSTGSLGLLLPPSLVVILYGLVAQVNIMHMFLAGLLPGILLVLVFLVFCVWKGRKSEVERAPFKAGDAFKALGVAAWELFIPVLILVLFFGGFCDLNQSAAITAVYVMFVTTAIKRDFNVRSFFRMLVQCGTLVGGVFIILGMAIGLTNAFIEAQVSDKLAAWVVNHIDSRWQFLIVLNLILILVGCFMDIYSALFVMVPLLLPIATQEPFNVQPVHLGVIFLANLQLGYITPPIGMNLFLGSFRFEKPMMRIAKYTLPFLFLMAIMVLLFTYVEWLSTALVPAESLLTFEPQGP